MSRWATRTKVAGFAAHDLNGLVASASKTSTVVAANATHDSEPITSRVAGPQGGARYMFVEAFLRWPGAGSQTIVLDLLYAPDGVNFVGKMASVATLSGDGSTHTLQHICATENWIQIPPFDFKLVARNTGAADLQADDLNMINLYPVVEVWK
jgi:hypothetical protein